MLKGPRNTYRSGGTGPNRKGRDPFLDRKNPGNQEPMPPSNVGRRNRISLLWGLQGGQKITVFINEDNAARC